MVDHDFEILILGVIPGTILLVGIIIAGLQRRSNRLFAAWLHQMQTGLKPQQTKKTESNATQVARESAA